MCDASRRRGLLLPLLLLLDRALDSPATGWPLDAQGQDVAASSAPLQGWASVPPSAPAAAPPAGAVAWGDNWQSWHQGQNYPSPTYDPRWVYAVLL